VAQDKNKRLNVYLVPELRDFVEQEAERMGVSLGSMVSFMVAKYKENKQVTDGMEQLMKLITEQKVSTTGKGIEGTQEGGETD
jgi:surfactin synthase thioesterase subunit